MTDRKFRWDRSHEIANPISDCILEPQTRHRHLAGGGLRVDLPVSDTVTVERERVATFGFVLAIASVTIGYRASHGSNFQPFHRLRRGALLGVASRRSGTAQSGIPSL